jgi:peptidyl-prolyl cis-trans isomerase B (cyclophilin B)
MPKMKNILCSVFCSLLLIGGYSSASAAGESDKAPKYTIEVEQEGKVLGSIIVELFPALAPKHCANFDSLVKIRFYDGTAFHRVDPDFMIQGGDPNSRSKDPATWGFGDPGQTKVPAEFNKYSHKRGTLSAARGNDVNSADSQFFICVKDSEFLDGEYTAYGRVVSGMEIVDKIAETPRDDERPRKKITMKIVRTP